MGSICGSNRQRRNTDCDIEAATEVSKSARKSKTTTDVSKEELRSPKTDRKRRQRRHKKSSRKSFASIEDTGDSCSSDASSSSSENQRRDDQKTKTGKRRGTEIKFISRGSIKVKIYPDKEQTQEDKSIPKKKVFQDFISKQDRNASNMGSHFPKGNLIDTGDGKSLQVFQVKGWGKAADSVCHIYFPTASSHIGTATGFRVGGGKPYIMTANHVVEHILDMGYQRLGLESHNRLSALQQSDVYVMFNYITNLQPANVRKFFLNPTIQFSDKSLDVAILELDDCSENVPSSAFQILPCKVLSSFTLVGHSKGKPMTMDVVDKIIDVKSAQTKSDIEIVKEHSKQHMQSFRRQDMNYECPPHNVLTNPHRHLFHCKCSKGASGSPGVVALEDGRVVVVTMLLCGYPDWYYDEGVDESLKNTWPQEYCVEQGVNFSSLYDKMQTEAPQLYQEIFSNTLPAPNL